MYSKRNIITYSLLLIALSLIIIAGCGGGGGNGGAIDPTISYTSTPAISITPTISTMSGYVYYTEATGSSKTTIKKAICSSTKITSSGYIPIVNATITLKVNGQKCHSDNEGHFQTNLTENISDYTVNIDPSTSTNANDITPFDQNLLSFIIPYGITPSPTSDLTIWFTAYPAVHDDNDFYINSYPEYRFAIVQPGTKLSGYVGDAGWYAISSATWSCDPSIGTIDKSGTFIAGSNAAEGKIYGSANGSKISFSIKVIKPADGMSMFYIIARDSSGQIAAGADVQLKSDGVIKYSTKTDGNGVGIIDNVAPWKYDYRLELNGYYKLITNVTFASNRAVITYRELNNSIPVTPQPTPTRIPTITPVPTSTPTVHTPPSPYVFTD